MSMLLQTLKQLVSPGGIEGYFATMYADCARNSEAMRNDYRQLAAKAASAIPGGKVLEVGSGPGYVSLEIARLLPEVKIVGLDLSETMIEIATRNADEYGVSDRVKFRQGDASAMPFEESLFDFVVSCGSLHHWQNPPEVFDEIHRVLKPGCSALIDDLRRDASPESMREWTSGHESRFMRWGARHSFTEAYTAREIEDILEDSAFENFDVKVEELNLEIWLRK
jgi:ubiquinone/menaquinone biosynthesis C-methylase UbiE